MILDWRKDSKTARLYDVLDAVTGESHPCMEMIYADDEAGVYRCLKLDEKGSVIRVSNDGLPIQRESPHRRWKRIDNEMVPLPNAYVMQPDGVKRYLNEEDIVLAWEEIRQPIRIVRKPA